MKSFQRKYNLNEVMVQFFWAELTGVKFENPHENYEVRSIWSMRDISKRVEARKLIKTLNENLSNNNRYLKTILNTVPIPVYIKDTNFRYQECNKSFAKLLGKSRSDIIGLHVNEYLPTIKATFMQEKDEQARDGEYQFFKECIALDGQVFKSIEYHKQALIQNGKFQGLIGVLLDVTERDQQEADLQEKVNQEVQKNIQQERIYQREQLRNTKFASIGKLAAGITHEINTPLTYIKGNFELLQEDIHLLNSSHKKRMIDDCESISSGIERIANIVEAMREMSQKSQESKSDINLYATLITALTMANNRAKQISKIVIQGRPFTIGMDKYAHDFSAYIQPQRIEQVWIIIINNALDELIKKEAFEHRSLTIEIEEDTHTVTVRFHDNAGGIPEEILNTLFDPFTSTKESSGIGIGLNIAQQIIEEHGGTILAHNDRGGAVFEVILPKKPTEAP